MVEIYSAMGFYPSSLPITTSEGIFRIVVATGAIVISFKYGMIESRVAQFWNDEFKIKKILK